VLLHRLEQALSEPLPSLPAEEQAELDTMPNLSDEALWTLAREQTPMVVQERMQFLMDRNSLGTISDQEYDELEELVERGNRRMLHKGQATVLSKNR